MANGVSELASIYTRLIGARIRSDLQYRASFVMFVTSQFLVAFLDFVAIAIIFSHVPRLAGWSLPEVMFLYGATNVSFNLADLFISQIETLPMHIRLGTFDSMLVRPLGPLFQLATEEFALRRIGKVAQGVRGPRARDRPAQYRLDCRPGGDDGGNGRGWCGDLRRDLGHDRSDKHLDDRHDAVRKRFHLRRELPVAVPHRRLRRRGCGACSRTCSRWRS